MRLLLAVLLALTLATAKADDKEVVTFVRWSGLVIELSIVEFLGSEPEARRYMAVMATDLIYDLSRSKEKPSKERVDAFFASEQMVKWAREIDTIIIYDTDDNVLHTIPESAIEYKLFDRINPKISRGNDLA